jgi:hypothetical protein
MSADSWIHIGIIIPLIGLIIDSINSLINRGRMQQKIDTLWSWFEKSTLGGK